MKNVSIKIALLLAVFAGGASAAGASDLPDCPTAGIKDNCVGTWTGSNEVTYIGEFKDNQYNGQGTYTYADGGKYVGQWKDSQRNGQGTYTSTDRTMREGIWQDGNFLGTVAEIQRVGRVRQRKQDKYDRIYNACLLDKGSDEGTPVSSLDEGLKTTCASIAEDPSFLEGLSYN